VTAQSGPILQQVRLVDRDGFTHFEPRTENVGQGGRMGWMSFEAWLDGDSYHVWCAHDCLGKRVVTVLPWPNWQASIDKTGTHKDEVRPSFACGLCDSHGSLRLTRWLA
jgi:hypothetical protein